MRSHWQPVAASDRVPLITRVRVSNILGHQRVETIEITHRETDRRETIVCDSVIFTGDWISEHKSARRGAARAY